MSQVEESRGPDRDICKRVDDRFTKVSDDCAFVGDSIFKTALKVSCVYKKTSDLWAVRKLRELPRIESLKSDVVDKYAIVLVDKRIR